MPATNWFIAVTCTCNWASDRAAVRSAGSCAVHTVPAALHGQHEPDRTEHHPAVAAEVPPCQAQVILSGSLRSTPERWLGPSSRTFSL